MTMLFVPKRDSTLFTWEGKLGVCEASDLGRQEIGGRVYDDACDYGFDLTSKRTGVTLLMTEAGVDKDREGDITGWRFKSAGMISERHGKRTLIRDRYTDVEVLVVND